MTFRVIIPLLLLLPFLLSQTRTVQIVPPPYLFKDTAFAGDHYSFSENKVLSVYACAADRSSGKAEFSIPGDKLPLFRNLLNSQPYDSSWKIYCSGKWNSAATYVGTNKNPDRYDSLFPLKGVRIALDPGHIAGDYATARLERKSIQIKKDSLKGIFRNDTIIEGKLTMLTARLLKKMLEDAGATVMLTREKDNQSAFGKDFDTWMKEDFKRCLDSALSHGHISSAEKEYYRNKAGRKIVFRDFFLQEDLRERARKINAFAPDLTFIIHYNVDEKNEGWTKPTQKNFNMVFIPGAFMKGALEKKEARFNFLRLYLSDHFSKSARLAGILAEEFKTRLRVPLAGHGDAKYLDDNCLKGPGEGVWCRNLALTRLIAGPLAYGESLYQDNANEYKALTLSSLRKEVYPERVKQVALAYYHASLRYTRGDQ